MGLKELIYEKLMSNDNLIQKLSNYNGSPAIFLDHVPSSEESGWNGQTQYPYIRIETDMQVNTKRKCRGTIKASIYCDWSNVITREIETEMKNCFRDLLIKPEDDSSYCLTWRNSTPFCLEDVGSDYYMDLPDINPLYLEKKDSDDNSDWRNFVPFLIERKNKFAKIFGFDVYFELLEYASQRMDEPDPTYTLDNYLKQEFPNGVNVGEDSLSQFYSLDDKELTYYLRLASIESGSETNTFVWMKAKLAIHVLVPKQQDKVQWITKIVNKLALEGELILPDHMPMKIKGIQVDYNADCQKDGQITIEMEYGVTREKPAVDKVKEIIFDLNN